MSPAIALIILVGALIFGLFFAIATDTLIDIRKSCRNIEAMIERQVDESETY